MLSILASICFCQCSGFGYCNRYVVISHCCFNLHLLNDMYCGASFHLLICHFFIFLNNFLCVYLLSIYPLWWSICFFLIVLLVFFYWCLNVLSLSLLLCMCVYVHCIDQSLLHLDLQIFSPTLRPVFHFHNKNYFWKLPRYKVVFIFIFSC